mmetsp:Transcript_11405/g.23617  ORF Transcript_11405/g.23617 Transcript_11405/m.23617 type:complete len:231 (+) Transcript_11405:186-878(+)
MRGDIFSPCQYVGKAVRGQDANLKTHRPESVVLQCQRPHFRGANRSEGCWVAEQNSPPPLDPAVEGHEALRGLGREVRDLVAHAEAAVGRPPGCPRARRPRVGLRRRVRQRPERGPQVRHHEGPVPAGHAYDVVVQGAARVGGGTDAEGGAGEAAPAPQPRLAVHVRQVHVLAAAGQRQVHALGEEPVHLLVLDRRRDQDRTLHVEPSPSVYHQVPVVAWPAGGRCNPVL